MLQQLPKHHHLVEASWEVCNKVGGIHTVLTTKLAYAQAFAHSAYLTVGPLFGENPSFHPEALPDGWQAIVDELGKKGIELRYGHWITEGHPPCVLLGWNGLTTQLNALKARFWEKYQLDTLKTDFYDVDTPLLWSVAVGEFVSAYQRLVGEHVLFHGHEWLSAGAFLVLADDPMVKTVFTTHATVLGRALSSLGEDIYTKLASIDPVEAATKHNVVAKHQLEKLGANLATVFTTVSSLTGREATAFLGRTPTVITENGIDTALFPNFDELSKLHEQNRELLHNFLTAYFFGSYRFDLNQVSYQFTMGRYEAHNKGYDLYLQALGQLNTRLQEEKREETVVAIFFVPGDAGAVRPEVLHQFAVMNHIREQLAHYSARQQRELYRNLWEASDPSDQGLRIVDADVVEHIKQLLLRLPTHTNPPISPFELRHPESDAITQAAAKANLTNAASDRVKVLFFPAYFDGFDGLFNRPLYELISGCDLGVFPSLYEPWGYTPMESLAMGVPAITTDLAGFGLAVEDRAPNDPGTQLVLREGRSDADVAKDICKALYEATLTAERAQLRKRIGAYLTIEQFDWSTLYERYREAYSTALA